jgi:hypothetical protein
MLRIISGLLLGGLVLSVAGCEPARELSIVSWQEGVRIETDPCDDAIDWYAVNEPFGGKIYDRTRIIFGSQELTVVGFGPFPLETHGVADMCGDPPEKWTRLLVLDAGERRNCFLFVLLSHGQLYVSKWICYEGACDAYLLAPREIIYCFQKGARPERTTCSRVAFQPVQPGKVYIDDMLADDLQRWGQKLPAGYLILKDPAANKPNDKAGK